MTEFFYNVSPSLKKLIEDVENLRRDVILTPLSPQQEMRYRFEAQVQRIYWSLSLSGNSLSRKEMIKIITMFQNKKLDPQEQDVIGYRNALRYIYQEWSVTKKMVTVKTVQTLHDIASPGRLKVSEAPIKQILDYLQAALEHPLIQASIAHIQLLRISPFTDGNGRTSRLLALLFLYKDGYDIRGLAVPEEYWRHNLTVLHQHTQNAMQSGNLTIWIEYFVQTYVHQLTKVKQALVSEQFSLEFPSIFWQLNDRQKEIIATLEQPGATITNKKVQKLFKISQITASRDLAKLASLNLLFPHGKGRSVYYTKV